MSDAKTARLLLSRLEKSAFVLSAAGRFAMRAAKTDPLSTGVAAAAGTALGPTMLRESMAADPVKQQRALQRARVAQQATMGKQAMRKVASVRQSDEDVRQGAAIRRSLEKHAASRLSKINLMSAPNLFMAGAMLSAGAATGGAAALGVANVLGKATERVHEGKQSGQFAAMTKADPSLGKDPKARAFFNVLQRASPYIASEPYVAAATVRSMLESPEGYALHPKFVSSLLEIEERRQKTRFPAMRVPPLRGELPDMD